MQPRVAIAIKADYDGRWATKVVSDAKTAAAGINTAGKSMQAANMNVANLAAQFNDIGVTLASGQNPLLVALQQGTQIGQVLGPMGAGGAVKALGSAFLSLLSPVNLLTIGTIALAGAAVQYFTSVLQDGSASAEELKAQADLIRKVAEQWGDAAPQLKAYVDQLDRAREINEKLAAVNAVVEQSFAPVNAQVGNLASGVVDAVNALQAVGAEPQLIIDLQNAFGDLEAKVKTQTATAEDAKRVQDTLAAAIAATGIPVLDQYAVAFADLARSIAASSAQAASFKAGIGSPLSRDSVAFAQQGRNDIFIVNQQRLNGLTTEQLAIEAEIARVKAESARSGASLTEQQLRALAQGNLDADKRRADVKSAAKEATAAAKKLDDGLVSVNKRADDLADTIGNSLATAATGLFSTLRTGGDAVDYLANKLGSLADTLLDSALQSLFGNIAGSLFGVGGIGGLKSSPGLGGLTGSVNYRAAGGPVVAGRPYIVGEKQPELFVPSQSGMILPNVAPLAESGPELLMPERAVRAA